MYKLPLQRKRLRKDPPEYLECNRLGKIKTLTEDELIQNNIDFFDDLEKRIPLYNKMGTDISFLDEWMKKWWGGWLDRDMDLVETLVTKDIHWMDPICFGKPTIGMQEFVDYNDAFFDALPDWRYDLIDSAWIDVIPGKGVRTVLHYYGSGHWDNPLKLTPFDESALSIPGTGEFMQCQAVDRYYFNEDGICYRGETLYDMMEALQMSRLLPSSDSWQFGALTSLSQMAQGLKGIAGVLNNMAE